MDYGLLSLYKTEGETSRDVDNYLQRKFQIKRVGHLGTLDPFAEGLLVIAIGKLTKLLPYLDSSFKTYEAVLKLGEKTDTLDKDGEVIERKEAPTITKEMLEEASQKMLLIKSQVPPMYSALKKDGKPLYKLARKGIEVERKPREIEVRKFDILSFNNNEVRFFCDVKEGTYVRSLGETFAEYLGTVGHLTSLKRLSIGSFSLKDSKKKEDITLEDSLNPVDYLKKDYDIIEINDELKKHVMDGKPLNLKSDKDEVIITYQGSPFAYYAKENSQYLCKRGLF